MNIFDSDKIIVIPVNTIGVMGKGLAYQFSRRFPHLVSTYKHQCFSGILKIGHPTFIDKFVMFPTKQHWKYPSQLAWIEDGLKTLPNDKVYVFPRLGCGLGGLDWQDVKPLIEKYHPNSEIVE